MDQSNSRGCGARVEEEDVERRRVREAAASAIAALKQLTGPAEDKGLRELLLELQAATAGALQRGLELCSDGHVVRGGTCNCQRSDGEAMSAQSHSSCSSSPCPSAQQQQQQHQHHHHQQQQQQQQHSTPDLEQTPSLQTPAPLSPRVGMGMGMDMGMATLHTIRRYMAQVLGSQASVADDEKLHFPTRGENADCSQSNTLSVDSFLFDSDDVDELTEAGELPSHYCQDCGSRNVQELTYISHSMSLHQLRYLFRTLVPKYCPGVSHVLDIGSRLGAVLFAGYCLSPNLQLTGIEMNHTYVSQQRDVVARFNLSDRVQVIEGDIRHHLNSIHQADLIVLHNVFEFFGDQDFRQELWRAVLGALAGTGAFVVTVPAIEESLASAELPPSLMAHLEPIPLDGHTHGTGIGDEGRSFEDDDDEEAKEDVASIFLYKVKAPASET